jgi:cytochrome c-type biogenesis protein CcmF
LTKRYSDWVKPALSWTFAGVAVLGVGILMGGAWAYEALSFGGFWAWDPVENASLVPWLTLVAAGHLMMVEKHKHSATGITLFMALFTFWLVLYSTFLTRSGVLGDSSVHSFVDLGLSGQLLVYLLFFVVGTAALLAIRWKSFPKNATDELLGSREFWMFIGSITLLLSALQIAFSTSLPVFNKLIGPDGWIPMLSDALAPPTNANEHYNRLQMPFAIVVSVLMAVGPFLVWRSNSPLFWKRILPAAAASVVLGGLIAWGLTLTHPVHVVLLVVSLFSALANVDLWLRLWRGNSRHLGMTTAHVGFALVLLGSLISQGKKEFLSVNKSFIHKDFPANENTVLELKDTVSMVPYWVTWTGERREGQNHYYDLTFMEKRGDTAFTLSPFIQMNERMGNVPEPDTRHFWNRDVYTHVTFADLRDVPDSAQWKRPLEVTLKAGEEAIVYDNFILHCDTLEVRDAVFTADGSNIKRLNMALQLRLVAMDGSEEALLPIYSLAGDQLTQTDAVAERSGVKARFASVETEEGRFKIQLWRRSEEDQPFILIQAIAFPWINLLWLGSILMGLGSALAVVQRVQRDREKAKKASA